MGQAKQAVSVRELAKGVQPGLLWCLRLSLDAFGKLFGFEFFLSWGILRSIYLVLLKVIFFLDLT